METNHTEISKVTIARLHTRLDSQDEMLREIKSAIVANEHLGNKGLVRRLSTVEEEQQAQGKKLLVLGGSLTGAFAVFEYCKDKLFGG